jgi:hypothetical protein
VLAACHPGALDRLHAEVRALLAAPEAPRHLWLRDLVVFEGYHEALERAVAHAREGGPRMTPEEALDPDLTFRAYLRWCAEQPPTPAATIAALRAGRFRLDGPLRAALPARAAATAADLRRLPRGELAALLAGGHPVEPEALAGWIYRGVSLGLPAAVERLTWKKFAKVFVRGEGGVQGWNVRVAKDPDLDAPVRPLRRRGRPVTFGPFAVVPAERGVCLDYGARHGRLHPLGRLRDPVVAVNAGSADLLLGRSDLALGGARLPTPSYFTLERDAPYVA